MGWLTIDIAVDYLFRTLAAFVRRIESRQWPTTNATIFRTYEPRKDWGCTSVVVRYRYLVDGEKYTAMHREPFLFDSPGSFSRQFARGAEITVRYKKDDPSRSIALV
jgi:hypothetical protein